MDIFRLSDLKKDKHFVTKQFLEQELKCPKLIIRDINWDGASDPSSDYNCVGFAVGYERWWQPYVFGDGGICLNPEAFWPKRTSPELAPDNSVDAYVEVIKWIGFEECGPKWEAGCDKITLYFDPTSRLFHHAAMHLSPQKWKSKFGHYSDFEHSPDAIDGGAFGAGRVCMKREVSKREPALHHFLERLSSQDAPLLPFQDSPTG